nr:unnamed protein product [Callosobruchus chinensis]
MSSQNVEHHPKDEGTDSEDTTLPPTYLVVQLTSKIHEETLRWLIDKLRGRKSDGGGELVVMKQPVNTADNFILHISASKLKLLKVAEEIELVKADRFGKRREFTVAQLEDFVFDGMHVDDLLTDSEKQTIVRHELENIRALSEDKSLPGYSTHKFYESQSIFQACQHWGVVTKVYPLHDQETLKKLGRSWYMSLFAQQPLEEIRLYFGEAIALYFKFLDFYTRALIVPVVLGFLQLLVSRETVPFFCVFNVVWVTLCLELWKRKSNELAFMWNTIGMTSMDEPRPNFRGTMGIDAITGKIQPQSPRYMTYVKMYGVSLPLTVVCMVVAFYVMLLPFWAEDYIKQLDESYQQYLILPSLIYSLIVPIMNVYFRMFATFLTEWENHRTQSQYDRHRVTKLVLFEFVNNFLSLFYIGFILRDMEMLRSQLRNMLIMSQAICSFQEIIQPVAMNYYSRKLQRSKLKLSPSTSQPKLFKNDKFVEEVNILTDIKIPTIQPEDVRIKQALKEGEMEIYEDPYDDYLELFIQFGYVFLFSSVYPVAAFWALLNNVLEIRADAFKLCKVFQRPMCRRVKDIGAWQGI